MICGLFSSLLVWSVLLNQGPLDLPDSGRLHQGRVLPCQPLYFTAQRKLMVSLFSVDPSSFSGREVSIFITLLSKYILEPRLSFIRPGFGSEDLSLGDNALTLEAFQQVKADKHEWEACKLHTEKVCFLKSKWLNMSARGYPGIRPFKIEFIKLCLPFPFKDVSICLRAISRMGTLFDKTSKSTHFKTLKVRFSLICFNDFTT